MKMLIFGAIIVIIVLLAGCEFEWKQQGKVIAHFKIGLN